MARTDDYKNAKKIAMEELARQQATDIAKRSGFEILEAPVLKIPFLDRVYSLRHPDGIFTDMSDGEKDVPIQEQVLILHYLMSENSDHPTGNWVSYREIPGAAFYYSAFIKRAVDPLKKVFGSNSPAFHTASKRLQARPIEIGDAGYEYRVFPNVPVRIILWIGDDEFPTEVNILFDESIGKRLSPEDIAWMAGMLVYRLISLSKE